jgi:hypothetical protein
VPYGGPTMSVLRETYVDGVRCLWVESGRPTLAARLLFRQGMCDEPLHESGWLHLIEHLALHGRGGGALQVNGSIGMLVTSFDAHGPAELVAAHLSEVTSRVHRLDPGELQRECRVLRAEAGLRASPAQRAFGWRYGAQGPGVVSYAEPGLGRAGASELAELAGRVFTQGNAVLGLDGPPPSGLHLSLPEGSLLTPSPAVPCESKLPAAYRDAPGTVVFSGVVPRSWHATLIPDLLEKALRRSLRDTAGGAYAPGATYEPVDSDHAVVIGGSDLLPDMEKDILRQVKDVILPLGRHGPPQEDLDQVVLQRLQALDDPYGQFGLAIRGAYSVLNGDEPETVDEIRSALQGADVTTVERDFAQLAQTALYGLPPQATNHMVRELEFDLEPPRTQGTTYRNINWPAEDLELVVGEDRVELRTGQGVRAADIAELAGMVQFPDGARHLVRADGYGFTVDPRWWHRGQDAVGALDSIVPKDRQLPGPDRDLEPVSRASAYTRLRARLQRWAANPIVMALALIFTIGMVVLFMATGRLLGIVIWGWAAYAIVRQIRRRHEPSP